MSFRAPGDDWYDGKANHYEVVTQPCGGGPTTRRRVTARRRAGSIQSIALTGRQANVYAVDEAGNRGPATTFRPTCHAQN